MYIYIEMYINKTTGVPDVGLCLSSRRTLVPPLKHTIDLLRTLPSYYVNTMLQRLRNSQVQTILQNTYFYFLLCADKRVCFSESSFFHHSSFL